MTASQLSQLPNYTAKGRILTGEHSIKTRPAPALISEHEVEGRIRAIKQRMLREGYTKSAAAIEEEVSKRHEALRRRPGGEGPQPSDRPNGNKRNRPKPPPDLA